MTTTTTFTVGQRVRLTSSVGGDAQVGDLGTVDRVLETGALHVKFDGREAGVRGDGIHYVQLSHVEPWPASAEPAPEQASAEPEDEAGRWRRLSEDYRSKYVATVGELEQFKAKVHEVASREAESRGWCAEVNEILEELGLPHIDPEIEVEVTVTATVELPLTTTVTVRRSEYEAGDLDEHLEVDDLLQEALQAGSIDYWDTNMTEWTVTEAEEA